MKVRLATVDDIDSIVEMGAMFYDNTIYPTICGFNVETMENLAKFVIDGNGFVLVAEVESGALVGMLGMIVTPFHFNHDFKTAHEVAWWAHPDHHSSGAGLALLRALIPTCREFGCSAVEMYALENSPPLVAKMYERIGLHRHATSFLGVLH